MLTLKAQLRSEQSHREIEGVVFMTFLGPSADPVVTGVTEQSAAYASQTKGKKGNDMGPPYAYIFLWLLGAITKTHGKIG